MQHLIIYFFCLLCACTNSSKHEVNSVVKHKLQLIETKENLIPVKNIYPEQIEPITDSTIIKAGNPIIVKVKSTGFYVPEKKVNGKSTIHNKNRLYEHIISIKPDEFTPVEKPIVAGTPQVTVAHNMIFKDENAGNFSFFGKMQGLKTPVVLDLLQDHFGNLWIATWNGGIYKYDGMQFTNYKTSEGLADNKVTSILADNNNNLWFGTWGSGVTKYDGKYFTSYSSGEGLNGNAVMDMIKDKAGHLWFVTNNGGATEYDGKTFRHYKTEQGLCSNALNALMQDHNGNIWFGSYGAGVSKYNGKSFITYTEKDGLSSNFIHSIKEDRYGNIWIATKTGATKFDGIQFIQFKEKQGLTNTIVRDITEDKEGNLWFSTIESGLFKYHGNSIDEMEKQTKSEQLNLTDQGKINGKYVRYFTNYTIKDGLCSDNISTIFQDKQNNIWIGTHGGLCKYNGRLFSHYTQKEGLSDNSVLSITEDSNHHLYFGTINGGFTKFNGEQFMQFATRQGLINNMIFSIVADSANNIWLATNNGITQFNGQHFKIFRNHITPEPALNMIKTKSGNKWIASTGALKLTDDSVYSYITNQGLANKNTKAFLEDTDHNIWVGNDGGISKYKFNAEGRIQSCTNYSTENGLSSNWITCITQDRNGVIWIGTTGGGINRYQNNNGKPAFMHLTEKEGLLSNNISSVLEDQHGNLWFGTMMGLCKLNTEKQILLNNYNLNEGIRTDDVLFENYSHDEGFLGIGCNRSALYEDKSGTIWIGTNDRLTAYHAAGDIRDTIRPNIQLTGIMLFNESIDWSQLEKNQDTTLLLGNGVNINNFSFSGISKWYNQPDNLSLAYNNNYLTFNFVGITTKRSKEVKYQYRLKGLDENWSNLSVRNEANYGNLPHGNFIFQVRAMNSAGFWSNIYNFTFTIRPPWWQTWWFYSITFLISVSMLFGFIKWRTHSLRIRQKHLENTVNMRTQQLRDILDEKEILMKEIHHRVKNNLEVISSLLELQSAGIADSNAKAAIIEGQNRVQSIALIHHKLYQTDEVSFVEFKTFVLDLYKQVESVFKKPIIEVDFNIEAEETMLNIDAAVPLGLILNELFTNSFKYGVTDTKRNSILVTLIQKNKPDSFLLTYRDNGPGMPIDFDPHKSDSLGMKVIELLTRQLGGKLNFYNENGSVFEIPFIAEQNKLNSLSAKKIKP